MERPTDHTQTREGRPIVARGAWPRLNSIVSVRAATLAVFVLALVAAPRGALAETVFVKYRGPVDLAPFDCKWVTRSSLVWRLCYDARHRYAIVLLRGTYYHYCDVPPFVVAAWRQADSMGRYYIDHVKGRFDCRTHYVPPYR